MAEVAEWKAGRMKYSQFRTWVYIRPWFYLSGLVFFKETQMITIAYSQYIPIHFLTLDKKLFSFSLSDFSLHAVCSLYPVKP